MVEIFFYHITENTVQDAIAKLLAKAMDQHSRVIVRVLGADFMLNLSQELWSKFILHGIEGEEFAQEQPILLTLSAANINRAELCFLVNGADCEDYEDFDKFKRVVVLFMANSTQQITKARAQWQEFKRKGYSLTYFQQKTDGSWFKNNVD
ncbi:DNA polymerase III subunit chi [Bartonella sp. TP]|uniref:DNA polymerase III subunit chi n=1 Tax=Bartonella sp. TP TaxID=3057550 RepID=UPI0025B23A38|nr:DNA polymerase III subunit chi [Bartonella sp. TP]MDN5249579.1 DNA polymerase III subunit chi [Alphaproteobacteria bacterium]WJW80112.1 DNA polymerase III subunit chi [Bartonella sp. TP]